MRIGRSLVAGSARSLRQTSVPLKALAREAVRLVPHADGLEGHRREDPPARSLQDLSLQPFRVLEIVPKTRTERDRALLAQHEPQLERAEAASQGDAPVAEVL